MNQGKAGGKNHLFPCKMFKQTMKNNETEHGGYPKGDDILLIKAAVKKGEEALRCWQDWSRRHVLETDVTLDRYRVLPFAYDNLSNDPAAAGLSFPHGVEGAFKKTFFLNSLLLRHLVNTQARLEAEGIPVMLLKGMAMLASGIYPRMGSRFQFDYDILVPFDKKMEAVGLFEKAGYKPCYEGGRSFHLQTSHSVGFLVPDMPKYGSFDVHWLPIALHKHPRTAELFFREKKEVEFHGHRFLVPPPELLLIQAVVHGMRLEYTSHTQWVCDVAAILNNSPSFDWQRLASLAETLQVVFFVKKALSFLQEVIGLALPEEASATLARLRHSAAETYLFSYCNKEKKGIADLLVWQLHESRQLHPGQPLPWHILQLMKAWRESRNELSMLGFARLMMKRLAQVATNSVPDYEREQQGRAQQGG